jgi:hypothetical protein
MKRKAAIFSAMGVAAGLVSGCGGGDDTAATTPPPTPPSNVSLDTQGVLALALVSSESTSPFAVDDGAVVLTDTSETTEPVAVDMMM